MELASLDNREIPQNVDECFADPFASVHYAEKSIRRSAIPAREGSATSRCTPALLHRSG